jgi:hypothetical protein
MKKTFIICALAASSLLASAATAAEVTWGAYQSNGIGTAFGVPLPDNSGFTLLIGHFNLTPGTIRANATNYVFLRDNFVQFGQSTPGAGDPNGGGSSDDGYWLTNTVNSSNGLGIQNLQIYYWLFNSADPATATEYGIFTAPSNPRWLFPSDTAIPSTTVTDLSDVPTDSTGILFGSFGTGVSRDGVSPLYNLAVVPEPSTYALLLVGAGAVAFVRRRAARR